MTTSTRDPATGRNFDGRYDTLLPCGCVHFYHGATTPCDEHAPKQTRLHDWRRGFTGDVLPWEDDMELVKALGERFKIGR